MTATVTAPPRTAGAAAGRKAVPLGAAPRVSLMPPELGERNRQLGVQRGLRLLMFAVVVLTIAAVGGAWYLAFSATLAAQAEQARTTDLLAEQAKYADVQYAITQVEVGDAALKVGGSTEIDWQDYLGRVQASLPAGVALDSFTVDASTVTEQYPQSSTPLQGARIATLQFSAISPSLPEIPDWLNRLKELPGYVDATPGSVSRSDDGSYTASIEMHIDSQAYSNRLTAEDATTEGTGQ
ncbi:PilN domain-containing protein [Protaetiibacter mangrovi]|uniref:Fimbrial assembly protein n=1 Tax=Protaetiibacter mangrovi TaxID=2970926 RepID=A0ABT1ZD44_9MICO|nr:hypothetical protein [Protaetiibacter mangrovi]MCS0498630.1 hypothetical protein [Protaetiibacter mangrovi]TPX02489.1 hypothetical protein FJ656_22115 [Schumannella luteola]